MGKTWGNLYYIRNIVYYKISSYEQRAFPNFFKESVLNTFEEVKRHGIVILPPAFAYYLLYQWGIQERERMVRKDPRLNDPDT